MTFFRRSGKRGPGFPSRLRRNVRRCPIRVMFPKGRGEKKSAMFARFAHPEVVCVPVFVGRVVGDHGFAGLVEGESLRKGVRLGPAFQYAVAPHMSVERHVVPLILLGNSSVIAYGLPMPIP